MLENRCPDCGSKKVKGTRRKFGFNWLLWPLSMAWVKPRKKCRECGAVWRT